MIWIRHYSKYLAYINILFLENLWGRHSYYPHFTDDQTEVQRSPVICLRSHSWEVAKCWFECRQYAFREHILPQCQAAVVSKWVLCPEHLSEQPFSSHHLLEMEAIVWRGNTDTKSWTQTKLGLLHRLCLAAGFPPFPEWSGCMCVVPTLSLVSLVPTHKDPSWGSRRDGTGRQS